MICDSHYLTYFTYLLRDDENTLDFVHKERWVFGEDDSVRIK